MAARSDEALYHALVRLQQAVGADRCTVYAADAAAAQVVSKVALGLEIPEIRLPMNRGVVGYVARTGHSLNLRDAYNDPRFDRSVDQQTGYRTRSLLTMAVRGQGNRIIGVIQALNKAAGTFTLEDEQAMQSACRELGELLESREGE